MDKSYDDNKKRFGEAVRKSRKKMGITQLTLENDGIISRKGLSDIENGKVDLHFETICMLIQLFHITPSELMSVFYDEKE